MKTTRLPILRTLLLLSTIFLPLMQSCTVWNTGGRLRASARTYTSADISRPVDGVAYVAKDAVYMEVPEVEFAERPYIIGKAFIGSCVTPVADVKDTGRRVWVRTTLPELVSLDELDKDKAKRGLPKWYEEDVSCYKRHFSILPQPPSAQTLAGAQKRVTGRHAAPVAAEELCPSAGGTHYGWGYPFVFTASLPLSAVDVGLSIVSSIISGTVELIRNPSLE